MMLANPRIVDVDGYVHVVDGKAICFPPEVYDLTKQEDVDLLLALAEDLYVDDTMRAIHGRDTVCVLVPSGTTSRGIFCLRHIGEMPESVQRVIRGVADGYDT